jgi:hypothetical protein
MEDRGTGTNPRTPIFNKENNAWIVSMNLDHLDHD